MKNLLVPIAAKRGRRLQHADADRRSGVPQAHRSRSTLDPDRARVRERKPDPARERARSAQSRRPPHCAARSRRCGSRRRAPPRGSASSMSTSTIACKRSSSRARLRPSHRLRRRADCGSSPPPSPTVAAPPPRPTGTRSAKLSGGLRADPGASLSGGRDRVSRVPDRVSDEPATGQCTVLARRDVLRAAPVPGRRCRSSRRVMTTIRNRQRSRMRLLKVGYCQDELNNDSAARTALQQVMRQFPDTTAARLASQRLERVSQ